MTCNESNCRNLSCALCYDCQQSLCLQHIILHQNQLHEEQLAFYEILRQLYDKLHSMNIERCYHQVFEQISLSKTYSIDLIIQLRSIREELIEQLNRFKQKQLHRLQKISCQLSNGKQMLSENELNDVKQKLEHIQTSIYSLVYGIHVEMSKTIQIRKIFHHKTTTTTSSSTDSLKNNDQLHRSSSWTNGLTDNYWTKKNELDERLSLL